MTLLKRVACIRFETALVVTTIVCALAALWMTLHRHEGYDILCARPSDLYQVSDVVRASDFSVDSVGRLHIELENLNEVAWTILEDGEAVGHIEGANPVIQLTPGIAETIIQGQSTGHILEVRSQWILGEPDALISLGSLRIGEASDFSISDFVTPVSAHPARHVEAARELLAPLALDEIPITTERVARLAAFLHHELDPFRGSPAAFMSRLNGLEQFRAAKAGRSGVYCANHAAIFAFMANVAGLPTRLVDVSGRLGDVVVGAHSFAETYVEKSGKWIYVDLQLSIGGVFDEGNVALDARELLERIRSGTTAGLMTHRLKGGRFADEPWSDRASQLETFLSPTAALVFLSASPDRFSISERLKRLLVRPRPALCDGALREWAGLRLATTWFAMLGLGTWIAFRARHIGGFCGCCSAGAFR